MLSVKGEEDDEDKRNASVSQERQRTLDRLRSLKQVRTPSARTRLAIDRRDSPHDVDSSRSVIQAR